MITAPVSTSARQMPATLAQAGIDPQEVFGKASAMIQAALEDPCCKTNPILVEAFMVRQILDEVAGCG